MDLFTQTTVFNPQLAGKAVHVTGFDVDGEEFDRIFLVKSVDGEKLTLMNSQGVEVRVDIESFTYSDEEALKIKILEAI